jgi:PIN domain nuclease of toxin-antitoxin system
MRINPGDKGQNSLLDTSALIALLKKEPGHEVIADIIAGSSISSVNLSEFIAVLTRSGVSESDIDEIITDLMPQIIPFCENISIKTGKLSKLTQEYGLSLGDRACIATGDYYKMVIYTTDKIWAKLNNVVSTEIIVIR